MTPTTKPEFRARMKSLLERILPPARVTASAKVCALVEALPEFAAARVVALYAPLPAELDVLPLATATGAAGKTAAFPRTNWATRELLFSALTPADANALVLGRLGLREPSPHAPVLDVASIDLLLVPGLAFDARGHRLGRGAGFYDRLLARPDLRALTVGVGFDEQLVSTIPVDAHDRALRLVVVPSGVVQP
jgi:5-formyltetrahydrofolate cyclo-ligase